MSTISPYLHITNGRLRVKVPSIKGSRKEADALERLLQQHPGVLSVQVNPITANTLVFFDESSTDANAILQYLVDRGYLSTSRQAEAGDQVEDGGLCLVDEGYLSTPTVPSPASRRVNGRLPALTDCALANSVLEVAVEVAVQAAVRQLIGVLIRAI